MLGPGKSLQRLNPFEIGDRHPPGVSQDVRDDEHPPFVEDRISLRRRWAIGCLGDQLRLNSVSIGRRNLVFQRRGDEDLRGQKEEILVGDVIGIPKTHDRSRPGLVGAHRI